jgi:glucose-6-phosphate isomerase
MTNLVKSKEWQDLAAHAAQMDRAKFGLPLEIECGELRADLSRHWLAKETLPLLIKLAERQKLADWRDRMLAGDKINHTENRAVWHVMLRDNKSPEVMAVKKKLYDFADRIRAGGKFKSIVNIGIGGSDLGPRLVTEALRDCHDTGMDFHFVSNIDANDLVEVLKKCDPATTLFIVASKTFTTIETLTNAQTARDWLVKALGEESGRRPFRRRFHRHRQGQGLRHRPGEHVRILGLGRRALQCLVGDRLARHARHRTTALRGIPEWRT